MAGSRGGGSFRPGIEGLRAVAVVLVVLYHCGLPLARGGYVGVDVFFVISGFLITRILLGEAGEGGWRMLGGFYARRARRILPAATLVAVATLAASAVLLSPLAARSVDGDGLAAAIFGINYRLAIEGSSYLTAAATPSPLQHYWSLSVEEQFYLLWPALLWVSSALWQRRGICLALALVAASSFAASVATTSSSPAWAYYALWTRGWELAVGGLLALAAPAVCRLPARATPVLGWSGLAAIGAAAVLFSARTPFPGDAALLPVLGAGAVIAAGEAAAQPGPDVLLGLRPVRAVGRWSYSWYLWHFPLLVLVPAALGHALSWPASTVVAGAALVLAAGTYRFVEQPVRTAGPLVRRPVVALGAGAVLVASTVTAGLASAATLPSLTGPGAPAAVVHSSGLTEAELQADLRRGLEVEQVPRNLAPPLGGTSTAVPVVYSDGCHADYAATTNPACVFGDRRSHFTVVLFGDSHAAQWFPALDAVSAEEHWRLVSLTKSGCPPVVVDVTRDPGGVPYPQCPVWRSYGLHRIASMHPQVVVVSWDRKLAAVATAEAGVARTEPTVWGDGVAALLRSLVATRARVIVIGNTPSFPFEVPACLSAHLTDADQCTADRGAVIPFPTLLVAEESIAESRRVPVLNPLDWFCTPKACPVIVGNVLVYRDSNHMVPNWSRFISPLLRRALEPLVRPGSS